MESSLESFRQFMQECFPEDKDLGDICECAVRADKQEAGYFFPCQKENIPPYSSVASRVKSPNTRRQVYKLLPCSESGNQDCSFCAEFNFK